MAPLEDAPPEDEVPREVDLRFVTSITARIPEAPQSKRFKPYIHK